MDKKNNHAHTSPPDDPTANTNNLFADTTGLTGMTQNSTNADVGANDGSSFDTSSIDTIKRNNDIASERETSYRSPKKMSQPYTKQSPTMNLNDDGSNKKYVTALRPSEQGEQSVSGDMPDPDSDDDTLANAQYMGMQSKEDTEHPQEIDLARDIDEAEEYIRSH